MKLSMKIDTKIALGFGSLLIIVALLLTVSLNYVSKIRTVMEQNRLSTEKLRIIHTARECILTIKGDFRGLLLNKSRNDDELMKNEIIEARNTNNEALKAYTTLPIVSEGEKEIIAKNVAVQVPPELLDKALNLVMTGNKRKEASTFIQTQVEPGLNAWREALEELADYIQKSDEIASSKLKQTALTAFGFLLVLGGFCIVLGVIIAYVIQRSITKPIKRIIGHLIIGAQEIAGASTQLAASAQQVSEGSAEQASAIEETSSTLEETTSMLEQNTVNTIQAAQLAGQAKGFADKGGVEMEEMSSSMQEIKKSSDQIAKVIKVIDDIAFQTNILALNAAVEAARAGEAGMGFAVVAEEVRNLAQRSAQAAKDTATMIETNINLSENGVSVTGKVRATFNEITAQTKKVNELMDEIMAASQEQAQGVEQVNKAISQIETVTQQNASSAEESASASEELNMQAENLKKIVAELSELVNRRGETLETGMGNRKTSTGQLPYNNNTSKAIPVAHQNSLPDHQSGKTMVVSPEDVIPLEKDNRF